MSIESMEKPPQPQLQKPESEEKSEVQEKPETTIEKINKFFAEVHDRITKALVNFSNKKVEGANPELNAKQDSIIKKAKEESDGAEKAVKDIESTANDTLEGKVESTETDDKEKICSQKIEQNFTDNIKKYESRDIKTYEQFLKTTGVEELVKKNPDIFSELSEEGFDMANFAYEMVSNPEKAKNYIEWYKENKKKPDLPEGKELDMNNLDLDQLVAVHKTDFFPENGVIKTRDQGEGVIHGRETIHFAINGPVGSHKLGDWEKKSIAIIVPADNIKKQIVSLHPVDTVTFGNTKLPKGAQIIINRSKINPSDELDIPNRIGESKAKIVFVKDSLNNKVNEIIQKSNYTPKKVGSQNWKLENEENEWGMDNESTKRIMELAAKNSLFGGLHFHSDIREIESVQTFYEIDKNDKDIVNSRNVYDNITKFNNDYHTIHKTDEYFKSLPEKNNDFKEAENRVKNILKKSFDFRLAVLKKQFQDEKYTIDIDKESNDGKITIRIEELKEKNPLINIEINQKTFSFLLKEGVFKNSELRGDIDLINELKK